MADYSSCPNCGKKAKKAISSNFFPVSKCGECGKLYCKHCGGSSCPGCGSSKSRQVGKVYAK